MKNDTELLNICKQIAGLIQQEHWRDAVKLARQLEAGTVAQSPGKQGREPRWYNTNPFDSTEAHR